MGLYVDMVYVFAIDFLNFNLLDCIADIEEQKACKGMCYAFPEYCLWGG